MKKKSGKKALAVKKQRIKNLTVKSGLRAGKCCGGGGTTLGTL
jgi:hypothetical protein